ncbi:MAG TPA: hypothetical protein VGG94_00715 [Chthoniobacterales bacterium]
MPENRPFIIQAAMVATALIAGVGIGHFFTGPPVVPPKVQPLAVAAVTPPPRAVERPMTLVGTPHDPAKPNGSSASHKTLEEIMKGPSTGERTRELEEYVRNLPSSGIGAALKQLRALPEGTARDLASGLLVAHWIETDPEGALQFAAQNHEFDYMTADVFQQMASSDSQGALARAQAIADPNMRYQALRGVLSYMADMDPLGALQLAGTLGNFPNNEPLSQMIYRQWASMDPQAAAAAAALASDGNGWRSPVGQVLRNWAGQDPLSAIAWANAQSDPSAQARDIGQIVRQWGRDDPTAAANWVNSLGSGATRDAAAAALAFSLGGSDPAAALGWAQSISDLSQRNSALERLTREIMYRNPSNGAAILTAAGIPQNMIPPPPAPGQGGRHGR